VAGVAGLKDLNPQGESMRMDAGNAKELKLFSRAVRCMALICVKPPIV
jgi:hypothetical protein